ncbi:hypothetical protein SGRIM119S_07273 [Streptomyces griseorubiginosus]
MGRGGRRGIGKSDPIDARRIAAAVLPLPEEQLRNPRMDEGIRTAAQILLTARDELTGERTRAVNALTALVRTADLGVDARRSLGAKKVGEMARWRPREEDLATATARTEAVRLARRILVLDAEITDNTNRIGELVDASPAAELVEETGIGPVTAATVLVAWSHPGRIRNEAAFAALAGVSPLPASSGNTTRHRLNRGGDRRLNRALNVIAMVRMVHHPQTRAYPTDGAPRARQTARSAAASSDTSPDASIATSTTPLRRLGLTGYRSFIGASSAGGHRSGRPAAVAVTRVAGPGS